ncbi:O-antigen/teichoic acid export membrane protein [Paralcaligenes ureilyticus]|uniref:O-antigen/teichoic acid export membrane protein n=2 Tax=Paralcaligenes ureilyticus TaxID=627131 RepID=A0A4R3M9Y9_9BURK|nr:O-antigen/teichoic acid export membrane protein [Paralcaligenes ureilyticus]
MVLILPIVTRLYTPSDFSILAVYVSLAGIISVAACLRLDIAIPMPKCEVDAINLLALSLLLAGLISVIVAIPVVIAPKQIANLLGQPKIRPYLWLLPIGIFLAGSYSALQFWATRQKNFTIIARTRMSQALAAASAQIGMGLAGFSPLGLIVGQVLNNGMGVAGLGRKIVSNDKELLKAISLSEMRRMFSRYDRFPKYSAMEALANSAGVQLPMILIASVAIGPEAGFLALAMQVMQAPMALIGNAISQVYLSKAPDERRMGSLGSFTTTILGGLLKTGVGPLIFAGIVAPDVFAVVFGAEWHRAGVLVAWMTPWFIVQFLASPISMALHVADRQATALVLQIFGFFVRLISVLLAVYFFKAFIAETYAVSGVIFYSVYLAIVLRSVSVRWTDLALQLRRSGIYIIGWCILGLLCQLAINVVIRIS